MKKLGFAVLFLLGIVTCVIVNAPEVPDAKERARIDQIWRCREDPDFMSDDDCGALYQERDTEAYLRRWKR